MLSDVFAITPAHATVYVEIKGAGIEEAVVAELRRTTARCAVHSFDHAAIERVRTMAPEIPRGVLFERTPKDLSELLEVTGARDVWPAWRLIDQGLVDMLHAVGRRVIAWTVNSRDVAADLRALGVDGLCTDDVRLLEGL
jgi:glycerophosphoryl diester phosphodiesterase